MPGGGCRISVETPCYNKKIKLGNRMGKKKVGKPAGTKGGNGEEEEGIFGGRKIK